MDKDNTIEPIEEQIVEELNNKVETDTQDNVVEETTIEPVEEEIVNDFNETTQEDKENLLEPTEEEIVEENTLPNNKYARKKRIPKWLRFSVDEDIKYRGPLSYRALRIFAWVFLCLSQLGAFIVFASTVAPASVAKITTLGTFLSMLKSTMMPLFLIATFSILLNKTRKFSSLLVMYGGMAFVFFLLFILLHDRFLIGIVMKMSEVDRATARDSIDVLISGLIPNGYISYNIFMDLFLCTLFVCFVTYKPKRIFVGKKLIIFRLFALLPIAYEITFLILKALASAGTFIMSPYMYPFLTTKPPMTFIVFVVLTFYLKIRERIFNKAGLSKHDYDTFLKSNRNSWYFSVFTSVMIALAVVVDIILAGIVTVAYAVQMSEAGLELDILSCLAKATGLGFGQSTSMILVIPFILLFSYTRTHKDTRMDMAIPLLGIVGLGLVYFEELYQIITNYIIPQVTNMLNG